MYLAYLIISSLANRSINICDLISGKYRAITINLTQRPTVKSNFLVFAHTLPQ